VPNVTFINIVSTTGAPGNFRASAMSTNFNNVARYANVTNIGFDSVNYATDSKGFNSNHIATAQFGSQHLTDGAVASGKLSQHAIGQAKVNFLSALSGPMIVQAPSGGASSFLPHIFRCSKTWSASTTGISSFVITWIYSSHAIDGTQTYAPKPIPVGGPVVLQSVASASNAISQHGIVSMDADQCYVRVHFGIAAQQSTITLHQAFLGFRA
jgi:hypothetical protein